MNNIYIFGHKKPDTDSIVSAIALSYLKNKQGFNTKAVCLDKINNETKFVLDYFKVAYPEEISDIRLQIKDLNYLKNCYIKDTSTIKMAYDYMSKNEVSTIPICDNNNKFLGIITMKNFVDYILKTNDTHMSDSVSTIIYKKDLITFNENEEVKDFIKVANRTKYSYYPIINKDNTCLGVLKLSHAADINKKKVIMVDHNDPTISVEGIEEAEIIEIIDHHNIRPIATNLPINFRNMTVGSTSTIVYQMYKENNIKIPKAIAGLLLSGIISDTLMFNSTTTDIDKTCAKELAKIARIDIEKYSALMFKEGSLLKGKTEEEIFYTDFKNYNIDGNKIGIANMSVINPETIIDNAKVYTDLIEKTSKNNNYDMLLFFVTDILKKGSYLFYNKKVEDLLSTSMGLNLKEGIFLKNYLSRKKQLLPIVIEIYEKK